MIGLTFKRCLCCLEDILVVSETFDPHIQGLNEVFRETKKYWPSNWNRNKKSFVQSACIYLGLKHLVKVSQPSPDRVKAFPIEEYPVHSNIKE